MGCIQFMFFSEPELQAAQQEVEQLRQEVEKLKKYGEKYFFMCILQAVFKELPYCIVCILSVKGRKYLCCKFPHSSESSVLCTCLSCLEAGYYSSMHGSMVKGMEQLGLITSITDRGTVIPIQEENVLVPSYQTFNQTDRQNSPPGWVRFKPNMTEKLQCH